MLKFQQLGSNQTLVTIGQRKFYFSYETCVAYSDDKVQIRRNQNYSKTTSKHLGQMYVRDWKQVPDSEFEKLAAM